MCTLFFEIRMCLVFYTQLDLHVKKHEIFWIPVPCIDNVGSCTYENLCELLANISCPPAFKKYGIPCHCPIAKVSQNLFLWDLLPHILAWLFHITISFCNGFVWDYLSMLQELLICNFLPVCVSVTTGYVPKKSWNWTFDF